MLCRQFEKSEPGDQLRLFQICFVYQFIGPGGHNSNRRQIRRIVNEGRGADLARSVARRLGRQDELPWSKMVMVSVVRGKFAVDDYFHGSQEPVSEQITASCPVERMAE